MPHVITVANQKGGVGKTTIACHLAAGLSLRGYRVLLVDADPQGSATRWRQLQPEKILQFGLISMPTATIHKDLPVLFAQGEYDFAIIDTPPSMHLEKQAMTRSALLAADMCIVPISVGFFELDATAGMKGLIDLAMQYNENLKAYLLINLKQPNTRLSREMRTASEDLGLPILKTELTNRVVVREALLAGSTVLEYERDSRAAEEWRELIEEVLACQTANNALVSSAQ